MRRSDVVTFEIEKQNVVQVGRQDALHGGKDLVVLFGVRRIGGNHFADDEQQGIHVVDVVIYTRRSRVRRANGSGPGVRKIFVEPLPEKSSHQKQ